MRGYSAEIDIDKLYVLAESEDDVDDAVREQILNDPDFQIPVTNIQPLSLYEERKHFGPSLYGEWCDPKDMDETTLERWHSLFRARASAGLLTLEDLGRGLTVEQELERRDRAV